MQKILPIILSLLFWANISPCWADTLSLDYNSIEDCNTDETNATSHLEVYDSDGMMVRIFTNDAYALFRVDLSTLPGGSIVTAAKLTLTVGWMGGTPDITIYSFTGAKGKAWSDTACTHNKYDGVSDWTNIDGGFTDKADAITAEVSSFTDEQPTDFDFNAIGLTFVQNAAGDDIEFIVVDTSENADDRLQFHETEFATEAKRPTFEVTYTTAVTAKPQLIFIQEN